MTEIFEKLPIATTADDYEKLTQLLLSPVDILTCKKKEGWIKGRDSALTKQLLDTTRRTPIDAFLNQK